MKLLVGGKKKEIIVNHLFRATCLRQTWMRPGSFRKAVDSQLRILEPLGQQSFLRPFLHTYLSSEKIVWFQFNVVTAHISTNTWIASSGLSCSDFYSVSGTSCGIAVACIEICERNGRRALECGRSLAQKLLRTSPNTILPCILGNADTKKTKKG